tara:strand:+ start:4627 stop:5376 length:750 start_codon:yes stop_codon:yes gene_type:complete
MARSFIYDNIGFSESTVEDGTVSSTTFDPAPTSVTNEERANDMSISTPFTSFAANDALRFNVGSSKTANCIALYYTSDHGHDFKVYAAASATSMGTAVLNHTASILAGWNIIDFTSSAGQYWFLQSTTGVIDDITEVIIGSKYTFAVNPELKATTGEAFGTDIMTSYGGNEYANKRHEPKTTWDWNWSHILSTQKTALESLNASVQDWKKFIYYDDTNYHYVRMTKPVTFTEVAPNIYNANMSLREQLS